MKKTILSLFILLSVNVFAQLSPRARFGIVNDTTDFGINIPKGSEVVDLKDSLIYLCVQSATEFDDLTSASVKFKWINGYSGDTSNIAYLNQENTFTEKNTFNDSVNILKKLQTGEAIIATGTLGSGWTEPNLGTGTRMMWYPRKGAFRAGAVTDPYHAWDNDSIGDYSIGMGLNTKATGDNSVSIGYTSAASGNSSVALGEQAWASGYRSYAIGRLANSTGGGSIALGEQATAQGQYSVGIGAGSDATGKYSMAFGAYTNANSYYSVAVGVGNVGGGDPLNWVSTDPLFEIGNNIGVTPSNAFEVKKNGNTIVGGTLQIKSIPNSNSDTVMVDSAGNVKKRLATSLPIPSALDTSKIIHWYDTIYPSGKINSRYEFELVKQQSDNNFDTLVIHLDSLQSHNDRINDLVTTKQDLLTNPVTTPNIGVSGYIPHYSGAGTIDTSNLFYDAANVRLGLGSSPLHYLDITRSSENQNSVYGLNVSMSAATLQSDLSSTGNDEALLNQYYAWPLTASASHTVGGIAVRLKTVGTVTNTYNYIRIKIYSDNAGVPDVLLATSDQVLMGSLTSSYVSYTFGITYTLTSGMTYWIVVERSATVTGGGSIVVDRNGTTLTTTNVSSPSLGDWTVNAGLGGYIIYGKTPIGISGISANNYGVRGSSTNNVGVYGSSTNSNGVYGISANNYGVRGSSTNSVGVYSSSTNSNGVYGSSKNSNGGTFSQTGILTTANATNTLFIQRNVVTNSTGSLNATGNVLQITDDPTGTGTISGALISGKIDATERFRIDPRVVDGGSAIGAFIDTRNTLSTSGAKLFSLRNAGSEKMYVDYAGNTDLSGTLKIGSIPTTLVTTPTVLTDSAGNIKHMTATSLPIPTALDTSKLLHWSDTLAGGDIVSRYEIELIKENTDNNTDTLFVHLDTLQHQNDRINDLVDTTVVHKNKINSIYDSLGNIYTDGQVDALLLAKQNVSDTSVKDATRYWVGQQAYLTVESDPIWISDSTEVLNKYDTTTGPASAKIATKYEVIHINDSITWLHGMYKLQTYTAMDDETSIVLGAGWWGFGQIRTSNNDFASFDFFADGTVNIHSISTANVVNTDTDTKFCIFDAGNHIVIKNRIGGSVAIVGEINYSNVAP